MYDRIILDTDLGGKCLDGSAPSIYVKNSKYNVDNKKFIFYIQGGAWCYGKDQKGTLEDCLRRSETEYGSLQQIPKRAGKKGILSAEESYNPYFHDYTVIHVNYCDGSGHQGSREDPINYKGQNLWFKGKENTLTALRYAKEQLGMDQADEVMIAGTSAGGLAVITWADYIEQDLKSTNPDMNVYAVAGAGFFLDYSEFGGNVYQKKMQNILAITNENSDYINKKCQDYYKDDSWKCMFAEYLIEFVDTKIMLANSSYDVWQLQHMARVGCLDGYSPQNFDNCNDDELQKIDQFRENLVDKIEEIQQRKSNVSSWLVSCPAHNLLIQELFSQGEWSIPENSANNLSYTIKQFTETNNQQFKIIDQEIYPDNSKCNQK